MNSDRIKLNVGGALFETTQSTLSQSSFFRSYLERWKVVDSKDKEQLQEPLFIDRSAILFDHVLSLLRNPEYPFPVEHIGELDYYGVEYDNETLNELKTQKDKQLRKLDICFRYVKEKIDLCRAEECDNYRLNDDPRCKYCETCGELVPDDSKSKPIERGDLVLYSGKLYYYQPNGTQCNLYNEYGHIGYLAKVVYNPSTRSVSRFKQRKRDSD